MAEQKKKSFRWRYFIDKPFQIRFIVRFLVLIILGLGISLVVLAIMNSQKYNQNVYFQSRNVETDENGNYLFNYDSPFVEVVNPVPINVFELQRAPLIWMSVLFLFLISVFGLFISHKMAGPVYRIKKTLNDAVKGDIDISELKFRLRKKDELQDLVEALNEFLKKYKK